MSENKHTPEPWRAFNNGEGVVGVGTDHSDVCWTRIEEGGWLNSDRTIDTDYENARRIVACVNACAGIPTYQLTAENDNPTNLGEVIDAIRKQRDELLEVMLTAAETFASYAEIHAAKTPPDIVKAEFNRDRAQMCFAAIASVKEKK